jgi:hypothetical protein
MIVDDPEDSWPHISSKRCFVAPPLSATTRLVLQDVEQIDPTTGTIRL